jgi:Holliday junction resolvase RusA-like endonuclease
MKFTIPIEPVGQMRARHSARGGIARTHKAPKQATAEQRLLAFAAQHRPDEPIDGPLEVRIDAYMQIPASMSKFNKVQARVGALRPTKKPDADNIAKHLLDCFNGIFWTDDKNIVGLMVRKFYSDFPRWEVEIRQA